MFPAGLCRFRTQETLLWTQKKPRSQRWDCIFHSLKQNQTTKQKNSLKSFFQHIFFENNVVSLRFAFFHSLYLPTESCWETCVDSDSPKSLGVRWIVSFGEKESLY